MTTPEPIPQFRPLPPIVTGVQIHVYWRSVYAQLNEDLNAINEWLRSVPKENE